jgi:tRNA(fMet)-specific endonuclease VapC
VIHLLDTDCLISMIRGGKSSARHRQREDAMVLEDNCRRTQAAGELVGLSAVTVSELEFGARLSSRYDEEMAAVRQVLTPFRLYDYDAVQCPRHYGRIRQELESAGLTIGSEDLLIAAHAVALNAVLVTNNEGHFGRVSGLKVVNWLKR